MALNAEQMFLDALGREPSPEEIQDIRLNLWMLTHAGFAVDDPSNAPLIAPWAWMWARLPRQNPSITSADLAPEIVDYAPTGLDPTPVVDRPAAIEVSALADAVALRLPPLVVQHRIDGSVFLTALRESFTLLWVGVAAFAIGLALVLGWHFGARHVQATLAPTPKQSVIAPRHSPPTKIPARADHRLP